MKRDIISTLRANRTGMLLEGVDASVKSGFKDFLSKTKLAGKETSEVRQILNDLFICADEVGKNNFKYGKVSGTPAQVDNGDGESGPGSGYDPATSQLEFYIFFDNGDTVTENLDSLRMAMDKKKHKFDVGPDNERYIDHKYQDYKWNGGRYEGPMVYLTPNERKGYIAVTVVAYISEGTDVSSVAIPSGKVGEVEKRKEVQVVDEKKALEGVVCPKCGSKDVNIHNDGTVFHCVPCGYEWSVNDADDCGTDDDKESPEDIKKHTKKSVDADESKSKKTVKESASTWDASEFLVPGGRYATENMGYIQVLHLTEGKCVIRNEVSKKISTMPIDESVMKTWVEVRVPV